MMAGYIKDTYSLLIGKYHEEVKEYLRIKYIDKPANMISVHRYLNGTLFDIISRAEIVITVIFDPYNIYEPKKKENIIDIDFSADEINAIIKRTK